MLEGLACGYFAKVKLGCSLQDRRVLLGLYAQFREVLNDVGLDDQFEGLADLFLAVDHYVCKYLNRSVETGLLGVEREDELTDFVGFNGRERHLVHQERLSLVNSEVHVMIYALEVGVLQLTGLDISFLDGAEVEHFGLHVQFSYRQRVFVHRLGLFRNHLSFDKHFLRRL